MVKRTLKTIPGAYTAAKAIRVKLHHLRHLPSGKDARRYRKIKKELRQSAKSIDANTAVVIHLYYTEIWPIFIKSLKNFTKPFDLYITMPDQNMEFSSEIKRSFKNVHIFETPNRGRDVLPFLCIASQLEELGYKYVLKLHSKKSTHRNDGSDWMTAIVSSLLPSKPVLSKAYDALSEPSASLIGPESEYIALSVNFEANGTLMTKILSTTYDSQTAYQVLQLERNEHGFFAGTMFWARLDSLRPILSKNWAPSNFEKENGQIDGTFAHAMERVFSLVPQIEGKDLIGISSKAVNKLKYKTTNIPDWSNVYIGPKPDSD